MIAEWCAQVLGEAIEKQGKPVIFNTDQGSQFTSEVFINVLKNNEIKISMDGKGRALDTIFGLGGTAPKVITRFVRVKLKTQQKIS